ncbi:MAG: arsenite methyltransferase [Thermoflavifilum sp.]|nr:arsenite methyltransferase [Thermoflavifilum sp.]
MDNSSEKQKQLVREKYGNIAQQDRQTNAASCCGSGCCSEQAIPIMNDYYQHIAGYQPEADLGLGCGLPTQFAKIRKGDTVIDLGSGAGNDCFIARHETGETGRAIGIDFTPAMIEKARENAQKLGFQNVTFILGDIENIPVADEIADVVLSNCVLNLVPNKTRVFQEIFRILKPGGHFSISDVVLEGELPAGLQASAEMYVGCIAGAIQKNDYLQIIEKAGFTHIAVLKQKRIQLPDDILQQYLPADALKSYHASSDTGIYSITVYAEKTNP